MVLDYTGPFEDPGEGAENGPAVTATALGADPSPEPPEAEADSDVFSVTAATATLEDFQGGHESDADVEAVDSTGSTTQTGGVQSPVEELLDGTTWTREDVELVLRAASVGATVLALYLAVEGQT
jgi:hypothetical protein